MSIKYDDIKIFKAQNNSDTSEGGGKISYEEIKNGEVNEVFPGISRLDRTYGRVQLRKIFPAVYTDNNETYRGTHIIISKPPEDANTNCCMFHAISYNDTIKDAVNAFESYVTKGYRLIGYKMLGKQTKGSIAILIEQSKDEQAPEQDSILYLEEKSGIGGEYVKIKKVKVLSETTTARKLEIVLYSPTRYTHYAYHTEYNNGTEKEVIDTYIYTAFTNSLANYYGITKLAQQAQAQDREITVENTKSAIIPYALNEIPTTKSILNNIASNLIVPLCKNCAPYLLYTHYYDDCFRFVSLKKTLIPGSVLIEAIISLRDDANGNIIDDSHNILGTIDYLNGSILMTRPIICDTDVRIYGKEGYVKGYNLHCEAYDITTQTRSSIFSKILQSEPIEGKIVVQYVVDGELREARGNESGDVVDADGMPIGIISENRIDIYFDTLPDIDTNIVIYYLSDTKEISDSHILSNETMKNLQTTFDVENFNIVSGTTVISGKDVLGGDIKIYDYDGSRLISTDFSGNVVVGNIKHMFINDFGYDVMRFNVQNYINNFTVSFMGVQRHNDILEILSPPWGNAVKGTFGTNTNGDVVCTEIEGNANLTASNVAIGSAIYIDFSSSSSVSANDIRRIIVQTKDYQTEPDENNVVYKYHSENFSVRRYGDMTNFIYLSQSEKWLIEAGYLLASDNKIQINYSNLYYSSRDKYQDDGNGNLTFVETEYLDENNTLGWSILKESIDYVECDYYQQIYNTVSTQPTNIKHTISTGIQNITPSTFHAISQSTELG